MKVYNKETGKGIEAYLVGITKEKNGERVAIFNAVNGYKIIYIPVRSNISIGDTFAQRYIKNDKGHVVEIEQTALIRQAQRAF